MKKRFLLGLFSVLALLLGFSKKAQSLIDDFVARYMGPVYSGISGKVIGSDLTNLRAVLLNGDDAKTNDLASENQFHFTVSRTEKLKFKLFILDESDEVLARETFKADDLPFFTNITIDLGEESE